MNQTKNMPEFKYQAFVCPLCGAYSKHEWYQQRNSDLWTTHCDCCKKSTVWYKEKMIYPKNITNYIPNPDLNQDIQELFNQANLIYNDSPRGACALLRLCVQKICIQLGEKGNDLNNDIGNLVKKGLPVLVQKSLDIARVIGNNAVHPGNIVIEDNLEIANSLFELVNFIADNMITEPKRIQELYNALPKSNLEQIEKRDNQYQKK